VLDAVEQLRHTRGMNGAAEAGVHSAATA
jgi:hypothetical protein